MVRALVCMAGILLLAVSPMTAQAPGVSEVYAQIRAEEGAGAMRSILRTSSAALARSPARGVPLPARDGVPSLRGDE